MRAVVLAAGKGERLGGLTRSLPKPMLSVGGEIILRHNLEWLRRAGIREVSINLHHRPETIAGYFGDGSRFGLDISYSREPALLGTAGSVRAMAAGWPEPFLVVYGDNFFPFDYDLAAFAEGFAGREALAYVGVYDKPGEAAKSGVVRLAEDGRIASFQEKPGPGASGLINAGVYLLAPRLLPLIPSGACDFGRDVFPPLAAAGLPVYGRPLGGGLVCVDTPELYAARPR